MDILDQFAGAGTARGGLVGGIGGGDGGDGRLVVEAVEVTAGLFEVADPFVRLGIGLDGFNARGTSYRIPP